MADFYSIQKYYPRNIYPKKWIYSIKTITITTEIEDKILSLFHYLIAIQKYLSI